MTWFYLVLAIIFLAVAHYFKVLRIKSFIDIYEKPDENNLLKGLSLGYIINFFLPFRLGDIFRAWFTGKKMKNGVSFGLATVIVDRILDIFVVAILFGLFYFLGFQNDIIKSSLLFYVIGGTFLLLFMIINYKYSTFLKRIIVKIAAIFNKNIELKLLKTSWYIVTSFKDLLRNISKTKTLITTIVMWFAYMFSYYMFSLTMQSIGYYNNMIDIFTSLFSKNSLDVSTAYLGFNNLLMYVYLIIPLFILISISFIPKRRNLTKNNKKYLELLPQVNINDKLIFLEGYFSAKSRDYYNNYIKINRDISILQDYSAGSNATTMLCTDNNSLFYRKYAFGKDSEKLYEQIMWLDKHKKLMPLTEFNNVKKGNGYCSYDMPYIKEAVSCFNYVHSTPISKSWKLLEKILENLDASLHKENVRNADISCTKKYIQSKVLDNIERIESGQYIKSLLKYDFIYINGKKYHNLNYFKNYLTEEYLLNVFKEDIYSDIHGDFTIENIICLLTENKKYKNSYYIIDPNTGNLHDSPNLDYAKLLQSIHGGYEFLMNTKSVSINKNYISYLFTKSSIYDDLYERFDIYLNKKFDIKKVKSIYFHEIIHWLRLLPYKIEKNGERSVLFYCGLIIIMNEIIEKYGDVE